MKVYRPAAVLLVLTSAYAYATDFNVTDFGAVADGKTDVRAAIQKTIDAAGQAGGGKVIIPASTTPYLVRTPITVGLANVEIVGEGATLKAIERATSCPSPHVLHITGTKQQRVENVVVRGLTVDADTWNRGRGRGPFRLKSRGVLITYAKNVLLDRVHVKRAYVSLAFSMGALDCEARECTVSNYHNDGFNAGDGATNIRFVRCRAYDAIHGINGGPSGSRDSAWEIEDGVKQVTLVECVVENTNGHAFNVKAHGKGLTSNDIRFIRCRVMPPCAMAWMMYLKYKGTGTEGVLIQDCETAADLYCAYGTNDVKIEGGKFGNVYLTWPGKVHVKGAAMNEISICAEEKPFGSRVIRPEVALENIKSRSAPLILGDKSRVALVGDLAKHHDPNPLAYFRGEDFWSKERFEKRAQTRENVRIVIRPELQGRSGEGKTAKVNLNYAIPLGTLVGELTGEANKDGSIVWKVQRNAPIEQCRFSACAMLPAEAGRAMVYSVSLDGGQSWKDVFRRSSNGKRPVPAACNRDITKHVKGRKAFLFKVAFKNGGGFLTQIKVATIPE